MATTQNIGRFQIRRLLGKGAQSSVYLAFDPHLEREVAIKTLHFASGSAAQSRFLLQEARTVSKLRHANIVPIFEAGEQDGDPYLVFEYVDGPTLAQLIASKGALAVAQAVEIMVPVLDAVGHAHGHGTIHRDLKPSNILISGEGLPRVMDFGIATRVADAAAESNRLMGTPAYMAPEYIAERSVSAQSDIFAAGLILYETLFGRRAISGDTPIAAMQQITGGELGFPESGAVTLDDKLRAILAKATALDPQLRYQSAQQMRDALQAYLEPDSSATVVANDKPAKGTLDFLLRRMRHKSDFPALSEAIRAINRLTASERENLNSLSNSILKDFALTNKILRLVNSVHYRQAGAGSISTVSRAIVVLGFNAIRNVAISLILFEHLQNQSHASLLKDEFLRATLSGSLARALGPKLLGRDVEEAFICAMFHNLGRLLTQYYFPEEAEEIRRLTQQQSLAVETACTRVLGMNYEDLGIGVAKAWGFPDSIMHSMRALPAGAVRATSSRDDRLRLVSVFANEACAALEGSAGDARARELAKLKARFGDALALGDNQLEAAVERAIQDTRDFCAVVRVSPAQSKFAQQVVRGSSAGTGDTSDTQTLLSDLSIDAGADWSVGGDSLFATSLDAPDAHDETNSATAESAASMEPDAAVPPAADDAQAILAAGIQDISNSLVEDFSLNDMLRIILETMYRAMGFRRVVFCIRDPKTASMSARFGFGPDIDALIKRFRFRLGDNRNIFNVVLGRGVDILISDAADPAIAQRIPDWYRKATGAQTFIVFPLVIKNLPVAMIYADKERAGEIVISERELTLLRTLRNQAVLAIKQST